MPSQRTHSLSQALELDFDDGVELDAADLLPQRAASSSAADASSASAAASASASGAASATAPAAKPPRAGTFHDTSPTRPRRCRPGARRRLVRRQRHRDRRPGGALGRRWRRRTIEAEAVLLPSSAVHASARDDTHGHARASAAFAYSPHFRCIPLYSPVGLHAS